MSEGEKKNEESGNCAVKISVQVKRASVRVRMLVRTKGGLVKYSVRLCWKIYF